MNLPDAFFDNLLPTKNWKENAYPRHRNWLHQEVPFKNVTLSYWIYINWRLTTAGSGKPDACGLILEAQDIRMSFNLRIEYGAQLDFTVELLQKYNGSTNYRGFLQQLLANEGIRLSVHKTYLRHWRGGWSQWSREITADALDGLFSLPEFEPIPWIEFESAQWVAQDVLLPYQNFEQVYQIWKPQMPPDFNPDQCRDLPELFGWLYSAESMDAVTYDGHYNLTTLPMSGNDEWYLNLWDAVKHLLKPGSSVVLQDDGEVFWKIEFTPERLLYYREKL